jgi:hypothetical protein
MSGAGGANVLIGRYLPTHQTPGSSHPSGPENPLRPVNRPAYRRLMAFFLNVVRHVRLRAVAAGVGLAPAH